MTVLSLFGRTDPTKYYLQNYVVRQSCKFWYLLLEDGQQETWRNPQVSCVGGSRLRLNLPRVSVGRFHQHPQLLPAVVTVTALRVPPCGAVLIGFISAGATAHVHVFLKRSLAGLRLPWLLGGAGGTMGKVHVAIHVGLWKEAGEGEKIVVKC